MKNVAEAFDWVPAMEHLELVGEPVADCLRGLAAEHPDLVARAKVVAIDPAVSDTDVLCETYDVGTETMGNCVVVAGKRQGDERVAACVVRGADFADVNHVVKRLLDVRKASFMSTERTTEESGMEYGGITPVGLPSSWRVLIDAKVAASDGIVIGSGVRASKLLVPGELLAALGNAEVIDGLAVQP